MKPVKVHHHVFNAFLWMLFAGILGFSLLFVAFYYHGERFLKEYLYQKVYQGSDGLYTIQFDDISLNLLNGKIVMTNFRLIPDEKCYEKRRQEGKAKGTLYAISFKKLLLKKFKWKEIYLERILHLSVIELDNPQIRLIAFPDTVTTQQERFNQVYRDIYPVFSLLFTEVHVDSILINNGIFYGTNTLTSGKVNSGDWQYSAVLRDFLVEIDDSMQDDRLFYSRDIELRIHDFQYALADSLYFIYADEVGFSLRGERLFGQGVSLSPNVAPGSLSESTAGNLYQVFLPAFSIEGVDLVQTMRTKEIRIHSFGLDNLSVNLFTNEPAEQIKRSSKQRLTAANLYTIMENKLKGIAIDTVTLRNASFRYFTSISNTRPELRIERSALHIRGFRLDSLAHLDTTKILYADDIEFDLHGFTLALEDKLHELTAEEVKISTLRDRIEIRNTLLTPSVNQDQQLEYKSNSYYRMLFPDVILEEINIRKMFNTRRLVLSRLALLEPDLSIIQYRDASSLSDTSTGKETFLQKLNLVQHLIMPYMVSLDAGEVYVSNARIAFRDEKRDSPGERISGLVDLTLTGLSVDTSTVQHRKAFLDNLDIDLVVSDFYYLSPDSLHRVSLQKLHANSVYKHLAAKAFRMFTTTKIHPDLSAPSTLEINVKELEVNDFDHRKWIDKKWFYGGDIRLHEPEIRIRSVQRKKESTLSESFSGFEERMEKVEIGSLRIDRGTFDLEEREGEQEMTLVVPAFDFDLTVFLFDVTGWKQGIRKLRYDRLSFHPLPGNPVTINQSYAITFTDFVSLSYPPSFSISDLIVIQLPDPYPLPGTMSLAFTIPGFFINHLDLEQALFERHLFIDTIQVSDPSISLIKTMDTISLIPKERYRISAHPILSTPFHSMEINQLDLENGSVRYTTIRGNASSTIALDDMYADISGFRYDSVYTGDQPPSLFFCRDIALTTGPYTFISSDSLYTLSTKGLWMSTRQSRLILDSVQLIPNYSEDGFSRKVGYQTDRMDLVTNRVVLNRIDFLSLLEQHEVNIGLMLVSGLNLNDYRDKRIPFPTWRRPPMLQEALRRIPFPLTIDTVEVINGKVTYREQTGDEPGMIFFDQMNLFIRNFTTDSLLVSHGATLSVDASVFIMGQAKAEGKFRFPLSSATDTFEFRGKVRQIPMTLFNPMISNENPVRIRSGVVDSVNFHWIRGNHHYSSGLVDIYYHDLQIDLIRKKPGILSLLETEILTVLVNMAIPKENPGYFGIHRRGYIWYERNEEKGYLNFLWKSILNGVVSSVGINSEEQRVFKRKMMQMKRRENSP